MGASMDFGPSKWVPAVTVLILVFSGGAPVCLASVIHDPCVLGVEGDQSFSEIFPLEREVVLGEADSLAILQVADVAMGEDGRLYLVDNYQHCVHVVDGQGRRVGKLGRLGQGPGELKSPAGVLLSPRGEVLVADAGNSRVCVWDSSGSFLRTFPCPHGVGRMWWAGSRRDQIVTSARAAGPGRPVIAVYDLQGLVVRTIGSWPDEVFMVFQKVGAPISGAAHAVAENGDVFVCHCAVYKIRRYSGEGEMLDELEGPGCSRFRPPSGPPLERTPEGLQSWSASWTPISSLVALPKALVVQTREFQKQGVVAQFWVDIVDGRGKPLRCGMGTTERIVGMARSHLITVQEVYREEPLSVGQTVIRIRRVSGAL